MATSVTSQIDGVSAGLAVKAPVHAVATTNITLSGLQTVGGVVLDGSTLYRVLCIAQTSSVDNGIWDASSGSWMRAKDFDGNRDVVHGTLVPKSTGSGGAFYRVTTTNPIVIGTSEIEFESVSETGIPSTGIVYGITPAEIAALVVPVNYSYRPGNVLRYGANTTPGTTDMLTAIQNAVLQAEAGGSPVYFPAGIYYSSAAIELKHTASYFSEDTGIRIYGDGLASRLTRASASGVASATDSTAAGQAFFRCHGSNNIIENMRFYQCAVGIYFGQDPDIAYGTSPSSVCFNRMRKLWVDQCGTGLLVTAAGGTHYNDFDSIHVYESQIGIHLRKGAWTGSVANVNRNTFKAIRAARCYVGVLVTNGGTNSFYSVHAEGCNSTPTNNSRAYPSGLPAAVGTDGVGILMDSFGEVSDNQFFGCTHESCDYFVYNDAYNSQFYGCKFQDSSAASNIFVVSPGVLISETSFVLDGTFTKLGNSLTLGFDATRPAGINHSEEPAWYHGYTRQVEGNAHKSERIIQAGAIASSGTATVTIQPEESGFQETSSFILNIDIIGNCTASTLTHYKQCKVIGQRSSSRTLTRYYLFDEVAGRATGTPAGDATEPFTLALSVSSKNLQLDITAPARDFASVTVRVTDVITRA